MAESTILTTLRRLVDVLYFVLILGLVLVSTANLLELHIGEAVREFLWACGAAWIYSSVLDKRSQLDKEEHDGTIS